MIKSFEGTELRLIIKKDKEWFRASDVCTILKLSNTYQAVRTIEEDDLCLVKVIDTIGRSQDVYFVNEAGLYALIFKSKTDSAKRFKKWVFEEVLPSIRKTGSYSIPQELKEKSVRSRNLMTETWKENGVKDGKEYAFLTIEEYEQLKIPKGKRKSDFDKKEILLLQALEALETLNLHYNPAKGFIECKQSLISTAQNIKKITEGK